jgi:peptidoglycan hydrolase CwlO-like protein
MNEHDYKGLLTTYQKKSMDLFTQLVVAETKIEMLESKLREANSLIESLTNKINELGENSKSAEEDFV